MFSIANNCPTLEINPNELENLIEFIYKHDHFLKKYGGFKIQLNSNCQLALKKRKTTLQLKPINKQILKINSNNQIYIVKEIKDLNEIIKKKSLIKDESTFWSELSSLNSKGKELNVSLCQNQSFFLTKTSRQYFDINRLPNRSLLKLGGRKLTKRFSPYVKRIHEGGGIFPLSSAQLNLSSINYHHEGEVIYWYIIPHSERENLRKILNEGDNSSNSICFNHQQLFLSPEFLEKNSIRYYQMCQYPHEFIILSSGTLSQSFSLYSSWSESIDFALPSWIEEDYLNKSYSQCQCNNNEYLNKKIDRNLFRPELIQRYIDLNLSHQFISSKDNNNQDVERVSTPTNIRSNLPNDERTTIAANLKVLIPLERIVSPSESFSTSMITPPVSNYFDKQDKINSIDNNNLQIQYELLEEGTFPNLLDVETSDINMIDSNPNEDLSQINLFTNIDQNLSNNSNPDNHFVSYEEILDLLPLNVNHLSSTHQEHQSNQNIHLNNSSTTSSNIHITTVNEQSDIKKTKMLNRAINNPKTLYVSGLRNDVNLNNIRSHFIGSIKVTIKQNSTTPHLKYAFVLHRTSEQAKCNLQRPINFSLFGRQCRVQYANNCSDLSINYQNLHNKKLAITRIPENVSEDDLQHLFINGHILKYSPAHTIHSTITTKEKNKTLSGYAFILYDNEEEAANVIKHADQYQINGQPLTISFYGDKNHAVQQ